MDLTLFKSMDQLFCTTAQNLSLPAQILNAHQPIKKEDKLHVEE